MNRSNIAMARAAAQAMKGWAMLLAVCTVAGQAAAAAAAPQLKYDARTRSLEIRDSEDGPILVQGVVRAKVQGREVSSDQEGVKVVKSVSGEAVLQLAHEALVRIKIDADVVTISTSGVFDPQSKATFEATAAMGVDPRIALTVEEKAADRQVVITTIGLAEVPAARTLFDPQRDLALTASAAGSWQLDGKTWRLHAAAPADAPLVSLTIRRHYYRDTLGIAHYAPLARQQRWPTAPVVAMTWYGIEGWKNRPAQRKEWLYPNIDWVARHLRPYAGDNLVFQLDDNFSFEDDKTMRELADYIRSRGLVPGIWFTPFVVAPQEVAQQHPDWFLHDEKGELLTGFAGVNWGWSGKFKSAAGVLNVHRAEAVKNWYTKFWHKASETWNYDFFKIDGQPAAVKAYEKSPEGGIDAYRKGLQIGRDIVGPAKFINACSGTPVQAIGLVDGSRTGPDTGNHPHAVDVILRWNFLNNVCWWSDPDAAANLYKATPQRTRLNAQARVLTGQQFLTDDVWTEIKPEICRIWQRSFPTLDIRPVNLYPIDDWRSYDLLDLRVAKPWGTWDVVGLLNYAGQPAEKVLDLGRLPLTAERVHVFEYWSSRYLGEFPRDAKITRRLAEYEGEVFAVVPANADRPVLVSTSRHVTQGALDLEGLTWTQEGKNWLAAGRSSHLVAGDLYELVFAAGPRRAASVKASAPAKILPGGAVQRVILNPENSGTAEWQIVFEPIQGPQLGVSPATLDVRQGAEGRVEVHSLGSQGVRFTIRASDPAVKVVPADGELGPWPAKAEVTVSRPRPSPQPGAVATITLTVEAAGSGQPPQQVDLRVHAPAPENLALKAKARASSFWSQGYQAARAIDGNDATRWNSAAGDVNGCWLELTWPEPVELNQVEIDECVDFGPRIQAWRLESRDKKPVEIARGTTAGRNRLIAFSRPLTTTKLRLTIDKAAAVPTIWELKVYPAP